MAERGRMLCEACGVEMNMHAEKVDYGAEPSASEASAGGFDPQWGGVVEEFHTCPACGGTQTRRAAEAI
jgi:hypothetical protein